jgi:hypothetical protein
MQCLPGIFAIRLGPGYTYRLYTNKLFETANILSPVQNHVIENKYSYPIVRENYGVNVRKWYDTDLVSCTWTYTGIEFSVRNTITGERFRLPLVFFIVTMPTLLPTDSEVLENTGGETIYISQASTYMPAMLYSYDPFNTHRAGHTPSADITVSTAAMYPAHVKRLIIEDVIRKKESCAISYDEITQENASVTSCGHVFTTEAITRWLSQPSSARCCPMCKQVCQLS